MASLATGSVNFPDRTYENPPDFIESLAKAMLENDVKPEIEVFDLAMLYNAANLVKKGLVKEKPHVQFVMGIPNAMPARRSVFDFLRAELPQVLPGATWVAAGVARFQWEVNQWCLETGGHCRTGLEDTSRSRPTASPPPTPSCEEDRRQLRAVRPPPPTPAEARQILGLRAAA